VRYSTDLISRQYYPPLCKQRCCEADVVSNACLVAASPLLKEQIRGQTNEIKSPVHHTPRQALSQSRRQKTAQIPAHTGLYANAYRCHQGEESERGAGVERVHVEANKIQASDRAHTLSIPGPVAKAPLD
jgi:hypothetical protein